MALGVQSLAGLVSLYWQGADFFREGSGLRLGALSFSLWASTIDREPKDVFGEADG